jgi:hypothetical protein
LPLGEKESLEGQPRDPWCDLPLQSDSGGCRLHPFCPGPEPPDYKAFSIRRALTNIWVHGMRAPEGSLSLAHSLKVRLDEFSHFPKPKHRKGGAWCRFMNIAASRVAPYRSTWWAWVTLKKSSADHAAVLQWHEFFPPWGPSPFKEASLFRGTPVAVARRDANHLPAPRVGVAGGGDAREADSR